jgi:long-chain acyl-CoA synthetase
MLATGATIVYHCGDVLKIKEDLALVQPTIFVSVPRLFSRFYDTLKKKMGEVQGIQKTALEYGLSSKISKV